MGKNKDKKYPAKVSLSEFIGSSRDYYFIAVNTKLSMPALSNRISNLLKENVSFIGDYFLEESKKNANFRMCYAPIDEEFDINLVILENKTVRFDQNHIDKSEQNKGFYTLSLFDDTYYIFNRNGFTLFQWDLLEVDYLMIIFANKDSVIDETINKLMQLTDCKCTNVTKQLCPDTTSTHPKNQFIQKLLYKIAMDIRDFQRETTNRNFVSKPQLTEKNITYSKMAFESPVNPDYLDLLKEDQTFD